MAQPQIESLDAGSSTMTLSLDADLYPREVLYAAAYVFLDRAYVVLDRAEARFLVHLRGKQALEEADLRALAGELENELLAQALRLKVFNANKNLIECITALAISGAVAGPGGEASGEPAEGAAASDDGMDFLDDPLGIATPWEEKKKEP